MYVVYLICGNQSGYHITSLVTTH